MKTMKKLSSILLAVLLFMLSVTGVWAAPAPTYQPALTTYSITIQNTNKIAESTYEAYQVFSGTLAQDEKGTLILSNIEWGSGVINTTALMANLLINGFEGCSSAADVAEKIANNNELAEKFANVVSGFLGDPAASVKSGKEDSVNMSLDEPGYYLVKNIPTNPNSANNAITSYILQVVGEATAELKADVPKVEKKVNDINDSTDTEKTDWQDSADYDIGDFVEFQLTATLPANYSSYTEYFLAFRDTLSNGLTYKANSVVVYVMTEDGVKHDITRNFDVQYDASSGKLDIKCENLSEAIEYNSEGNIVESAPITDKSQIVVEYSAELNENAVSGKAGNSNTVYLEYSNNPNTAGEGTGKTPEDKVTVFTFDFDVTKVDGDKNPLAGAGFTLEKYNEETSEWATVGVPEAVIPDGGNVENLFQWKGLDDGIYRIIESTVPAGYNKVDDILFAVVAEHDKSSEDPQLTNLYVMYVMETANADGSASYTITDEPLEIFHAKIESVNIDTQIENNRGSTLPETGGVGTTVFYVVGGILVVGAVILLVTKKRMSKEG